MGFPKCPIKCILTSSRSKDKLRSRMHHTTTRAVPEPPLLPAQQTREHGAVHSTHIVRKDPDIKGKRVGKPLTAKLLRDPASEAMLSKGPFLNSDVITDQNLDIAALAAERESMLAKSHVQGGEDLTPESPSIAPAEIEDMVTMPVHTEQSDVAKPQSLEAVDVQIEPDSRHLLNASKNTSAETAKRTESSASVANSCRK